MPSKADDITVAAFKAYVYQAAQFEEEIARRVRRVDDCVMTRSRGVTGCGLRHCGAAGDRLCGDGCITLAPTQPVRGLWVVAHLDSRF